MIDRPARSPDAFDRDGTGAAPRAGARRRSVAKRRAAVAWTGAATRRKVGFLLILAAVALLVWDRGTARVGPVRVRTGQPLNLVLAAMPEDLVRRGDLVDVAGDVVRRGGGGPPRAYLAVCCVPASYILRRGDRLRLGPGRDVVETSVEIVRSQTDEESHRVVRYVQGTVSGRTADLEDVTVVKQAPPPRIALTFDDGPNPAWTPQVLDLLSRYQAKATFFVLGSCAKSWPTLLEREVAEGHEIAAHSYGHASFPRLSNGTIAGDFARFEAVVLPRVSGRRIRWFRPPYGAVDARVRAAVTGQGYRVILWDADTNDWRKPAAAVIANRILAAAKGGQVVLMHDGGGDRSRTVQALSIVLPDLVERGVEMVTVSQLKGLEPLPPGDIVIVAGGREWRGRPTTVTVTARGRPLADPVTAMALEGHLLLAAGPVLKALGLAYRWEGNTQALRVDSVLGPVELRVNSRRATLGERDVLLLTPMVRLEDQVLVAASLLAKVAQAVVTVSPDGSSVAFETPEAALETPSVGRGTAEATPLLLSAP